MDKKVLAAIAIAGLVALSGCSIPDFSNDDSPTPTGPTVDSVTYPEGMSKTSIDTETVVSNHESYINETSYTFLFQRQTTNRRQQKQTLTVRVSVNDSSNRALAQVYQQRAIVSEKYFDGNNSYTRTVRQRNSSYSVNGTETIADYRASSGVSSVSQVISNADTVRAYNVTTDSNQNTLIRYRLNGSVAQGQLPYNGTMTVNTDGVIRRLNYTITPPRGPPATISIVYAEFGTTTIDRPPWLGEARNNTVVAPTTPTSEPTPTTTPTNHHDGETTPHEH